MGAASSRPFFLVAQASPPAFFLGSGGFQPSFPVDRAPRPAFLGSGGFQPSFPVDRAPRHPFLLYSPLVSPTTALTTNGNPSKSNIW